MAYSFTPVKDFGPVLVAGRKSKYLQGMSYTVDDGNSALDAQVKEWLREGLVTLGVGKPSGPLQAAGARMTGTATIGG